MSAHNLPIQVTSFVGREHELVELQHLLPTTRLLTLTGAGGCGKTRLALRVASELAQATPPEPDLRDGIWFVELASLAEPSLLVQKVATTLELREQAGWPLLATLEDFLREKHLLLLIDNCEHLIEACAHLVEAVMRAGPGVRVLATSREPLNIAGETTYRVPSLPTPPRDSPVDTASLLNYDALHLFVDRARAAQPHFVSDAQHAPHVAEICRQLDGIPLAIELAAARLKTMSVDQIAARLHDRFHLLTAGNRTALPRHRTLGALIDWSYNLLSEPERALLQQLSVFAGGCTLAAAENVATYNGRGQALDVLDLLTRLVDKSLVALDEQVDEPRYRMLETIRQYAREKLEATGAAVATRDRHLGWYMRLAEVSDLKLRGAEQALWMRRLDLELDNLRAAMSWALESHQPEAGMRLGGAPIWYWAARGSLTEVCERLIEMLSLPEAAGPTVGRARALSTAGQLLALLGRHDMACSLSNEAISIAPPLGEQGALALAIENLGTVCLDRGDEAGATLYFERSAEIRRAQQDNFNLGAVIAMLGELALREGQYNRARLLLDESLSLLRVLEENFVRPIPLRLLSRIASHQGDYRHALALAEEGLRCNLEINDYYGAAATLSAVATAVMVQGNCARAVQFLGAVEGILSSMQIPLYTVERAQYYQTISTLRSRITPSEFERAWASGRAMTLEQTVAEAERCFQEAAPENAPAAAFAADSGLTEREREVLRWLARGLTDGEIAGQLVISRRTVNAHLRSIYNKLDVTTRTAAARYAIENHLIWAILPIQFAFQQVSQVRSSCRCAVLRPGVQYAQSSGTHRDHGSSA